MAITKLQPFNLDTTANYTFANANLGNAATANFFIGSGNNLSNVQGANVTGSVSIATTSGTVTTAAQPNITSTGSLTGLTISNATGIVNFTTSANVTLGAVANLHISGGTANYVLQTDGAGTLTWAAQSGGGGGGGNANIFNGTSNISIATSGGNVTTSVAGNANVLIVTSTGVNVAGNVYAGGTLSGGMVETTTNTVASNTTIATSCMVVGPMTINTSVTVTVDTGVRWVIF